LGAFWRQMPQNGVAVDWLIGNENRRAHRWIVGLGLVGLLAYAMVSKEPSAPQSQISKTDRCKNIGERAGLAMGLRQLGTDQISLNERFKDDPVALSLLSRAYQLPLASSSDGKALAARNFADSEVAKCLE